MKKESIDPGNLLVDQLFIDVEEAIRRFEKETGSQILIEHINVSALVGSSKNDKRSKFYHDLDIKTTEQMDDGRIVYHKPSRNTYSLEYIVGV